MSPSSNTTLGALLLSDTSVLVAFCKCGAGAKLRDHLADRVWVVDAVAGELESKAKALPNLQRLLDASWPPVIELPIEVRLSVADAMTVRAEPGQHPAKDEGEIATVLYADHARSEGKDYQLLLDDKTDGKKLAAMKGHIWTDTPALVVEMVCADVIDFKSGRRVWAEAVSKGAGALKAYESRVRATCPERVPPP